MCKSFSKQKFINVLVACIVFSTSYITATDWLGGNIDCDNSNIDQSFTIANVNNVVGPLLVQSNAVDINVTIGANAVLKSDDTEKGRIFISAAAGRTVTFNIINNDLKFRGSDNNQNPLLIAFSGGGELVFNLGNGRTVSFTSDATTEGARFYVCMGTNLPLVTVQRQNNNSPTNVEFRVGAKSCVTYVVNENDINNSLATGTIAFDPNNQNPNGCMILRLQDSSCFVIEGHQADKATESCNVMGVPTNFLGFTCDDVDLTALGGAKAFLSIESPTNGNQGNLRIVNENQQLTPLRVDPFCDNSFMDAEGQRWGFVLGANGEIVTQNCTYIDYIATGSPTCPNQCPPIDCTCGLSAEQVIKERNPSAFFVDGIANEMTHAVITMNGISGIYFRSGADLCGNVNEAGGFVINPGDTLFEDVKTPGVGHIVFDVEGKLDVCGTSANSNALHILSLEVQKTGCPIVNGLFVGLPEATDPNKTVFPARTFARNNVDEYLRYNSAAFLINNCMTVKDASIVHDDQNHNVFERDNLGRCDLHSEPTYIGGEAHKIECQGQERPRPKIALENSIFRLHTNAGLTGVDLSVPNVDETDGNASALRFYNNGCAIDQSYGRVLILGTSEGSLSCDGTLVDRNSHLDVIQTRAQSPANTDVDHLLEIQTADNDACVIEGLEEVRGCSVHTIFLGGGSNISVGTNQAVEGLPQEPDPLTHPKISVAGAFLSFETAGGTLGFPEASGTTGEGGIFVDQNGCFSAIPTVRVNMSTMVVKSGNGIINLPKNQVFFDNRIGITKWQVDLSDADDRILVAEGECLSDFTFDWGAAIRDCDNFIPYEPKEIPGVCLCETVSAENITSIPEIRGEVGQLQIKRSRLGDQVHLRINGGHVRELVMLRGFNTAEAPMGFMVIENHGRLGLGTAHRNPDSLEAHVKLGINGIMLAPNGNGTVELNEDIVIDNLCSILPGPDFGTGVEPHRLIIHSQDEKEFRIKSNGILDLSHFDHPNKILQFAGAVRVIAEPGAQIIIGSPAAEGQRGRIVFTDKACLSFDRILQASLADQTTADDLQPVLVKISGVGDLVFAEASGMFVPQQAFVAVQSHPTCALQTDIKVQLFDQAKFEIGTASEPGGSFQIGNTSNMEGASVAYELELNNSSQICVEREGHYGLAVGVASKLPEVPHNGWKVEQLFNVTQITHTINGGVFIHNQIEPGSSKLAGLISIGCSADAAFAWFHSFTDASILGGGNVVLTCSPEVLPRKPQCGRKVSDNMVIIQRGSNLPLDHFAWIPAESDHAKAIHIRLEPGATMSGAQGKVRLQVNSKKPLDLEGRELVLLSKLIAQMPEKAKVTRSKHHKIMQVAHGEKLALTKELTVVNSAKDGLAITQADLASLISLLTGNSVSYRMPDAIFPIVNDTAGFVNGTHQAGIMRSKAIMDQVGQPVGNVNAQVFYDFLVHGHLADLTSPLGSAAPDENGHSKIGYVDGTTIVRLENVNIVTYVDGFADQERSHRHGSVHLHRDSITGKLHRIHALSHQA